MQRVAAILLVLCLVLVPGCRRRSRPAPPRPVPATPSPTPEAPEPLRFGAAELVPAGWSSHQVKRGPRHLTASLRLEGQGQPIRLHCLEAGSSARAAQWIEVAFRHGRKEPGLLGRMGVYGVREQERDEALGLALGPVAILARADVDRGDLLRGYVLDLVRRNKHLLPGGQASTSPVPAPTLPPPEPTDEVEIPVESWQDPTPEATRRPPTRRPSPTPTRTPTSTPTRRPRPSPSPVPTRRPSPSPSPVPTWRPSPSPSPVPTRRPSPSPSPVPTLRPSPSPSPVPTLRPSPSPSPVPTLRPSPSPTPVAPDVLRARLLFDQARGREAGARLREAYELYEQAARLGSTDAETAMARLRREYPSAFGDRPPVPVPTVRPSPSPSPTPTERPSPSPPPTRLPSPTPIPTPTERPSPSPAPTRLPSPSPSPSAPPSERPSPSPSATPSRLPSPSPSVAPTLRPSQIPTPAPSQDLLDRARAAWARGDLRGAYDGYVAAEAAGSLEAKTGRLQLERELHRRSFQLFQRAYAGGDTSAAVELESLEAAFPEVFPASVPPPSVAASIPPTATPTSAGDDPTPSATTPWILLILVVSLWGLLVSRTRRR